MAQGKLKSKPTKSSKNPKEDGKEKGQQLEDDVVFRRVHWDEGVHAPDELISAPDELFEAVAPMWKGELFDKNIMNGGTGRGFTNSHHKKGAGGKGKRDFMDLTFAFCLEPIKVTYNNVVYRCRCLNQFCVKSYQCIVHSKTVYKDGPNSIYTDMLAGRPVTWSRIDMGTAPVVAAPLTIEQQNAAIKIKLEELDTEYEELRQNKDVVEKLDETRNRLNKLSKAMSKTGTSDWIQNEFQMLMVNGNAAVVVPTVDPPAAAIYGARRSVNNSAPGNSVLDQKALSVSRPKAKGTRATFFAKSTLATVVEEPLPQKRKAKKCKNEPTADDS